MLEMTKMVKTHSLRITPPKGGKPPLDFPIRSEKTETRGNRDQSYGSDDKTTRKPTLQLARRAT
jgi:hypothetical protein